MELKDLKYFVEIAELKSMRKAAVSLYISQPNLTRAIHGLEKELGGDLFIRSNRGVELTTLGEGFYFYAQSILQQMNEIAKLRLESEKYVEARVSVAIGGVFIKDEMMLQYYETIKANHTGIFLTETSVEEAINHVAEGHADIGVVTVNNYQDRILRKIADLKELELHEIGWGPLYAHVGKENPLYGRGEVEVEELCPYTRVRLPADFFSNINYTVQIDGRINLKDFEKTIIMNNYHAIISMVKKTDAFIFGNIWQKEELERGQICSLLLKNCNVRRELVWFKRKREVLSDKAEEFVQLMLVMYGSAGCDS